MLAVRSIETAEGRSGFDREWDALLAPDDPCAPFLGHTWWNAWWGAYGAGRRAHLLVAEDAAGLQAILPLGARWTAAGRELDLTANGHSPLADLVCRQGREREAAAAFAKHLLETETAWTAAVFAEVRVGGAIHALYNQFPESRRLDQTQRHAPYFRVDTSWAELESGLSRNFRRALRNNRNRMARAGVVEVERVDAPVALLPALQDAFAIADRSWQGRAGSGIGSTAAERRFYTDVIRDLGARCQVRLWFLRLGDRRIAFELHVVHAGVEFGLKTGYDEEFEALA